MKKEFIFISIYFIVAACIATYPLIFHITHALPHTGDELLLTWILNWNIHSYLHNIKGIFDTNIFYPYHNTLAYSDTFFSFAVIGMIPLFLFQEPLAVYNTCLLFAYASLGFCTYLLVRYLSKSWQAGIISGTLVAFSTYSITKTMHLQLIGIFWVPLGILFYFVFFKTKKIRYIIFVCICLILQFANSIQPAYFLVFSLLVLHSFYFITNKKIFWMLFSKKIFGIFVVTFIVLLPIALPYFWVSKEFHYTRDIRDTIHYAARPEYTFWPSDRTRLQQVLFATLYKNDTGPYKYDGYVGFAFFVLYITSVVFFFKTKRNIPYFLPFFTISLLGYVTSIGPAFQWGGKVIKHPFMIPLPYAIFYYLIPGFNGMRNSGRWEMLFVLAGSVCIGLFLATVFKKQLKKWAMILTIFICVLVLAEINLPMDVTSVPSYAQIPQTYYFLKTLPENAVIIEMPAYVWNMSPYALEELHRQYYSTVDFKKRVNGGSGFDPPVWEKQIYTIMTTFPDENSIQLLKKIGVTYIVIHSKEYDMLYNNNFILAGKRMKNGIQIRDELRANKRVKIIRKIDGDIIYHIL